MLCPQRVHRATGVNGSGSLRASTSGRTYDGATCQWNSSGANQNDVVLLPTEVESPHLCVHTAAIAGCVLTSVCEIGVAGYARRPGTLLAALNIRPLNEVSPGSKLSGRV